jgi:D-alanyl-D-alanine carboxypeptidase
MPSAIDLSALDELFSAAYPSDQPGAAVIITHESLPLFRKGYGMANLELEVSIRPEMVFRIGSVTKQFTAVSILMLLEGGLLRLDDPLEKFTATQLPSNIC